MSADPAIEYGYEATLEWGSDLQTAVMSALPHACTIGRMESNWRIAANEFVRYLRAAGYDVSPVSSVSGVSS